MRTIVPLLRHESQQRVLRSEDPIRGLHLSVRCRSEDAYNECGVPWIVVVVKRWRRRGGREMAGEEAKSARRRPARAGCGPRGGTTMRGFIYDQIATPSNSYTENIMIVQSVTRNRSNNAGICVHVAHEWPSAMRDMLHDHFHRHKEGGAARCPLEPARRRIRHGASSF